jgi:UDP-glucose 4-epimerase
MCADSWRWQLANPRGFDEPVQDLQARTVDGTALISLHHSSLQPGQEND